MTAISVLPCCDLLAVLILRVMSNVEAFTLLMLLAPALHLAILVDGLAMRLGLPPFGNRCLKITLSATIKV